MEIDILIDKGLKETPPAAWFQNVAGKVLAILGIASETELSLVITTQVKIRRLNRKYLKKDRPTDVISFYTNAPGPEKTPFVTPPGVLHLGDVIISYPQAVLQAGEQGHSVEKEMTILIIHGILHLLGYEDETPKLKPKMTAKEEEVLKDLGFKIYEL